MPRADGKMRNEEINALEAELNELEAKGISAKSQLEKVNAELKELKNQEAAIENTKGFFNRGKVEEELEPLLKRRGMATIRGQSSVCGPKAGDLRSADEANSLS